MAKFKKVKIDPSGDPATVWAEIRDFMLTAQSVELVASLGPADQVVMEVRLWNGVRKDKSNADDAKPNTEY